MVYPIMVKIMKEALISVSSITKKPRSIDKNKQKWYNRSARKIAENSKKACTWGGAYV